MLTSWWQLRNKSLLPGEKEFSRRNFNKKHFLLRTIIKWARLQILSTPKGLLIKPFLRVIHRVPAWYKEHAIACLLPPPNSCFLETVRLVHRGQWDDRSLKIRLWDDSHMRIDNNWECKLAELTNPIAVSLWRDAGKKMVGEDNSFFRVFIQSVLTSIMTWLLQSWGLHFIFNWYSRDKRACYRVRVSSPSEMTAVPSCAPTLTAVLPSTPHTTPTQQEPDRFFW